MNPIDQIPELSSLTATPLTFYPPKSHSQHLINNLWTNGFAVMEGPAA